MMLDLQTSREKACHPTSLMDWFASRSIIFNELLLVNAFANANAASSPIVLMLRSSFCNAELGLLKTAENAIHPVAVMDSMPVSFKLFNVGMLANVFAKSASSSIPVTTESNIELIAAVGCEEILDGVLTGHAEVKFF